MQSGIINLAIFNAVQHFHAAPLQRQPMRPAGGFAQPLADIGVFALHQENFAVGTGDLRLNAGHAAARVVFEINAPFFGEHVNIHRARRAVMRNGISNIKTDAARAHNRHALTDRLFALQHINIADRFFMRDALNIRHTRGNAGGNNHMVEPRLAQHIGIGAGVEPKLNAQLLNHFIVIAHGLVKLFLARHQLGEVELPANFVRRVYQRHLVAALCRRGGIGQPGRSGTDNGNRFRIVGRLIFEQRFVAGTRINQTACRLAAKCMVEAGLITRNAGVNLIGAIFRRLIHKLAVSQHRARHRHQIRVAALKHFFGDMRHVDTI